MASLRREMQCEVLHELSPAARDSQKSGTLAVLGHRSQQASPWRSHKVRRWDATVTDSGSARAISTVCANFTAIIAAGAITIIGTDLLAMGVWPTMMFATRFPLGRYLFLALKVLSVHMPNLRYRSRFNDTFSSDSGSAFAATPRIDRNAQMVGSLRVCSACVIMALSEATERCNEYRHVNTGYSLQWTWSKCLHERYRRPTPVILHMFKLEGC
ncbi:hypothetical protein FISHEDRAFT_58737 [Fistulina hepatica ATCC 64428]|uniref:Uncharacterized protein n=1 Tax=Fistulina hepatica ATCC 64428 TaxID=1128425 RepID=A0A0D7ADC6_9AGAR|nr:hypothetical protein FISHEDRAFT_58737 [Fistulina hepatica ATCC 64428]